MTSGRPVVSQCAAALAATASSSGVSLIRMRSSEPSSWSAASSRSSVSRLASRAPSHRIAGPIRPSSARSGPMANGVSTTTIRKNSTPMPAPPPTRTRERRSRMNSGGERRSRARPNAAPCAFSSPSGPWVAARIMPPPARCCRIRCGKHVLRRAVERRGRLVEQPDRPRHREQPRERQPPPLPGGEVGCRQIGHAVEADRGQGAGGAASSPPRIARPEVEVLGHRQRRLQGVLMAEVVGLLRPGSAPGRRRPGPSALRRPGPARRSCAAGRTCRRRCAR